MRTLRTKKETDMGIQSNSRARTERLALMALLTAMVAVLAYLGGFIKVGPTASVNLTLIPVVLGAALCGPAAGAFLGGVAGAVFFVTADAAFWLGLSVPGTIITVMTKAILAGLCAGYVFRFLSRFNRYLAVMASAVVCPVVNTGLFLVGCRLFFFDTVQSGAAAEGLSTFAFLLIFYVGFNFLLELGANILLGPAIVRILDIVKKK